MKTAIFRWVTAVAAVLLLAASAYADLPPRPPATLDPAQANWVNYLITVVLLIAVAVASFKSSKRSHLD